MDGLFLQFTWDENKNRSNYRKHRVYFETATLVFDDPNALMLRDRAIDGEERWHTMGLGEGGLLLLVVHTMEGVAEEETIRITSARKATARERRVYEDGEGE
jgi:uncharacterized DUF497 family protein